VFYFCRVVPQDVGFALKTLVPGALPAPGIFLFDLQMMIRLLIVMITNRLFRFVVFGKPSEMLPTGVERMINAIVLDDGADANSGLQEIGPKNRFNTTAARKSRQGRDILRHAGVL